ncbi:helix-turn-helix transcriptional regulator [soil metagenome]
MSNKLGEFIRLHRERITPEEAGLPRIGRRRTPGLRREELAQLCAVSPTWLTWLEQGRPVSASAKVLGRLADLMHLTPAERSYLFRLADRLDPAFPPELTTGADHALMGADAIVNAIRSPAYILDQQWNAVAWNRPARELFSGWLDAAATKPGRAKGGGSKADTVGAPAAQPNLLKFMFLEAKAHSLIADWPERAQRLVAEFRDDCGKFADQEPLAGLIDQLERGSPDFKRLWKSQNVLGRDGGKRRFLHHAQGEREFEQVSFSVAARRGFKLVMLLPC